jgi:hypothetical protein
MQKNILDEDIARKFQTICDYEARVGLNEMTYLNKGLTVGEADDNAQQDPGADPNAMGGAPAGDPGSMGGDPGADPNAMGGAPAGGDPGAMGGDPGAADPNAMGGAPAGDPNAMGGDPGAMGGDAAAAGPEGFNPQGDLSAADFGGGDQEQPGDEVLDVTELTDKQEDIEDEVSKVSDKFDKVIKAIGAFEELLRSNDEKIEDLKAEFEKRNPTQVEKLSMQTAKSYPFNVTPEEFWKEKEATSNYSTEDDENGVNQGQYVITANDVNGDTNWKAIADSLDDEDFMYHQTLDKIMKL